MEAAVKLVFDGVLYILITTSISSIFLEFMVDVEWRGADGGPCIRKF